MTPFEKAVEAAESAYGLEEWDDPTRVMGVALTAALSALESEGWVLVPVEPTEAMLSAMTRHNADWLSDKGPYPRSRRVYSAMLSARPKAPQQEGE